MTQEEFNAKPLRLRPGDMKEILGLSYDGVEVWIDQHPAVVIETMPGGKRICSKAKVAEALKFEL